MRGAFGLFPTQTIPRLWASVTEPSLSPSQAALPFPPGQAESPRPLWGSQCCSYHSGAHSSPSGANPSSSGIPCCGQGSPSHARTMVLSPGSLSISQPPAPKPEGSQGSTGMRIPGAVTEASPAGLFTALRKNTEVWEHFLGWENIDFCQPEPQAELLTLNKTKMTTQSLVTAAPGSGSRNSNGCIQEGGMGRMGRGSSISSALAARALASPVPGILSGRSRALLRC